MTHELHLLLVMLVTTCAREIQDMNFHFSKGISTRILNKSIELQDNQKQNILKTRFLRKIIYR